MCPCPPCVRVFLLLFSWYCDIIVSYTHIHIAEGNYSSALRDSFLTLDQNLHTGMFLTVCLLTRSLSPPLSPPSRSLSLSPFLSSLLHVCLFHTLLLIDPKLGFQFEPGGTTAVVVLVRGGNLYCVSETQHVSKPPASYPWTNKHTLVRKDT